MTKGLLGSTELKVIRVVSKMHADENVDIAKEGNYHKQMLILKYLLETLDFLNKFCRMKDYLMH